MDIATYHILHVSSILALLGYSFYAFAAPIESRRRVLTITGVAALLVLVSGFGLLHKLGLGMPGWAIVKLVCWLGLSAVSGIAYRRRRRADLLMVLALVLAIVAVSMVYLKPSF